MIELNKEYNYLRILLLISSKTILKELPLLFLMKQSIFLLVLFLVVFFHPHLFPFDSQCLQLGSDHVKRRETEGLNETLNILVQNEMGRSSMDLLEGIAYI